ncbi:MAG: PKD domain-containing protein, partial [Thermoplasmata archaeon]
EGTARVQVLGPAGKFTELNASVENYTVIVPAGINITFSAEESTDPNSPEGRVSPEANFTWRFTNVSTTIDAYDIRPEVTFPVMGNYSGNLTIVETGGNSTFRDFTLFVDGLLPVARIENNVTGLGTNSNGTTITIKEGDKVRFFGGNSTDQVHDNMTGTVKDWKWDLDGDGKVDVTGGTVEWTFSEPGNFTVNLTVVDQGGQESMNATMWVVAEDITPPAVEFSILDTEFNEATSVVELKTYYFDASDTTDNLDDLEEMTFLWDFGDGNTTTGSNVSYVYENYGNYDVVLNVTDSAGNVGNATRNLVVEVDAKARPDLEIETGSLKIDPSSPEESTFFGSVIVTIRLNVSNKEDRALAENLQVSFWAFRSGESPGDPIFIEPVFYDQDGLVTDRRLEPGEKKTVEFTWVTGPLGNYTLRVNVTDPKEPDLFVGPRNSVEMQIDVREAGWKRPVFIAAIVGVIAGIPVAIYVRRKYRGKAKERITKK